MWGMRVLRRNSHGPCQLGGEEFVVVLPDADPAKAYHVGERLRQMYTFKACGSGALFVRNAMGATESSPMQHRIASERWPPGAESFSPGSLLLATTGFGLDVALELSALRHYTHCVFALLSME